MQLADTAGLTCWEGPIVNKQLTLSASILVLGMAGACRAHQNHAGLTLAHGDKLGSNSVFNRSDLMLLPSNPEHRMSLPRFGIAATNSTLLNLEVGEFPDFLRNKELPSLYEDADFALSYRMLDGQRKAIAIRKSPLPMGSDLDRSRKYHIITIVHLPSQTQYRAYATFDDEDDGGNTLGWVEDRLGRIVSRIDDSFFSPLLGKRI